jgi:hypothetical protein
MILKVLKESQKSGPDAAKNFFEDTLFLLQLWICLISHDHSVVPKWN